MFKLLSKIKGELYIKSKTRRLEEVVVGKYFEPLAMFQQGPHEDTVLDVATHFSEEEWKLLQEWQKELYGNVMKEIHQALISLGPLIATTVFSLRAKDKQEPFSPHNQQTERRCRINISPKEEAVSILIDSFGEEIGEQSTQSNSVHSLRKEEETVSIFINQLGEEVEESSTDRNAGHGIISFNVKDEEESYHLSHQDNRRTQCISNLTGEGSNTRKRKVGYSVQGAEKTTEGQSFLGKVQAEVFKSTEPEIDSRRQLEISNQVLGREIATQSKGVFLHQEHSTVHQRPPNIEKSRMCKNYESHLWAQTVKCQHKHYACQECPKSFSQKQDLIRHKRIHSGERPFQCTVCKKSFILKHHLIAHHRTHTGERPFPCPICNKRYRKKESLNIHQRTHMASS